MTKHILEQYVHMQNEERDLIRRIQSLDARILNIETNMIVSDTVTRGKKGGKSLGTVRIDGFPSRDYEARKRTLRKLKRMLARLDDELLKKQIDVEEYIESISDVQLRTVMRLRYIDGMDWRSVARNTHITQDAARKMVERYLNNAK